MHLEFRSNEELGVANGSTFVLLEPEAIMCGQVSPVADEKILMLKIKSIIPCGMMFKCRDDLDKFIYALNLQADVIWPRESNAGGN